MPQCKRHPKIETNLACGKCGDPICPKCMVETPVGARCPSCAGLSRVPTYRVSKVFYLRAVGAGLGAAILGSILWIFLSSIMGFFFWLLAAAIGYGVGELISLSVNRKSGTGLAVIGAVAAALCFLVGIISHFSLFSLVPPVIAIFVSVARLR
jgi:hypothetical protein